MSSHESGASTPPERPRRKLTPWQKIMRASKRGTGLRLSADEVWNLSRDNAIETLAGNDDEGLPDE